MTAGALQVVFHRYKAAALFKLRLSMHSPASFLRHTTRASSTWFCLLPRSTVLFPSQAVPLFFPFATAVDPPPFRHAAAHNSPSPLLFSCFTLPSSFITSETPHLKSVTRPPAHGAAKLCAINFREADVLYRAKLLHVQLLGPMFAHTRRRRTHMKQVLFYSAHSGAPTLRRNAITSGLLQSMAMFNNVDVGVAATTGRRVNGEQHHERAEQAVLHRTWFSQPRRLWFVRSFVYWFIRPCGRSQNHDGCWELASCVCS